MILCVIFENIEIEKVDQYEYLWQTEELTNIQLRIKAGWLVFGKYKEKFVNKKRQVFNQCILPTLTYGFKLGH